MHITKRYTSLKVRILTLLLSLTIFIQAAICQQKDLTPKEWAKKLADPADLKNEGYSALKLKVANFDSLKVFDLLNKINNVAKVKNPYFIARYNVIRARNLRFFNPPKPARSSNYNVNVKKEVVLLLDEAIQKAYIVDDDYLIAFVSFNYGDVLNDFGETAKSVMYMLYSAELYEKLNLKVDYTNYYLLGELLWNIREYDKCIKYVKTAFSLLPTDIDKQLRPKLITINTIGLAYHRLGQYDSANYYYQKGLEMASMSKDTTLGKIWTGIILGNIAQINYALKKYREALPGFEMDYKINKKNKIYHDAANSLQWAAKTNLALGHKELALKQIRESFHLLKKWPTADRYLQNAYQTAADIFKSLDNIDSTLYYTGKYNFLHDSLERNIYLSSLEISQLRLNNEKSRYSIHNLERRKNDQIAKRNFIIAGILLFGLTVLLIINKQKQKLKYKRELEHSENVRLENEVAFAKTQMQNITKSIIEKSNLIEKLQSKVKDKEQSLQEGELIADLAHQNILTDEDWANFKIVFEKVYPGLFNKIVLQFEDITQAELRMGALILLHLDTKEISSVLGISPNSVNKTKQRLRNRFNLESVQEIEAFIANI